jgi:hypothetical protein
LSEELQNLFAKKFIARTDVKAVQKSSGIWTPHYVDSRNKAKGYIPWRRDDLAAHIAGSSTYGHYLLGLDNTCKLFAFDVDFEKTGILPTTPWPESVALEPERWYTDQDIKNWMSTFAPANPREAWLDRAHPGRSWMKYQLKVISHALLRAIHEELNLHGAVAYSGHKGVHVYGFLGKGVAASDAREGAAIALEHAGKTLNTTFKAVRGDCFFKADNSDPVEGFANLQIEVFPKQDTLGDGEESFGNLMRLPLGRHLKNPNDPTFFIDMTTPMAQMIPLNPILALNENPWRKAGE